MTSIDDIYRVALPGARASLPKAPVVRMFRVSGQLRTDEPLPDRVLRPKTSVQLQSLSEKWSQSHIFIGNPT